MSNQHFDYGIKKDLDLSKKIQSILTGNRFFGLTF